MKRCTLRQFAEHDIEHAFAHYLDQAGPDTALDFLDEVEAALSYIERNPGTWSPRYSEVCEVSGLRMWLVTRYPYALMYIEYAEHLDILRVLHQHADIPERLSEAPSQRKAQFELTHSTWLAEQNQRFESHGLWCDEMRVW